MHPAVGLRDIVRSFRNLKEEGDYDPEEEVPASVFSYLSSMGSSLECGNRYSVDLCKSKVTQIPGWAPSVNLEVKDHVVTGEESEEDRPIEVFQHSARFKRRCFVLGIPFLDVSSICTLRFDCQNPGDFG